ncbi:MAG: bifunctional nuclease family protein [Spirochaetales bacterium]|nr:bifunctional nuclease family protein [Spirochaetales bacterium]
MRTARFLPAQIWTISQTDDGNAVYVRPDGSELVLPVYVSEGDVQTILVELTHIMAPRPMIYELFLGTVEALHGRLVRVEIYDVRGGSYLCRAVFMQQGKEISLESRPSDILCLAARVECPVLVCDTLLAQSGVPLSQVSSKTAKEVVPGDTPVLSEMLKGELRIALENEEYERAALLRDRLAEMARGE